MQINKGWNGTGRAVTIQYRYENKIGGKINILRTRYRAIIGNKFHLIQELGRKLLCGRLDGQNLVALFRCLLRKK
jgi:hypothetical protein